MKFPSLCCVHSSSRFPLFLIRQPQCKVITCIPKIVVSCYDKRRNFVLCYFRSYLNGLINLYRPSLNRVNNTGPFLEFPFLCIEGNFLRVSGFFALGMAWIISTGKKGSLSFFDFTSLIIVL